MNKSPLDQPLSTSPGSLPLSTYSFLLSEITHYFLQKRDSTGSLDADLEQLGQQIGVRLYEVICLREKRNKREINQVELLKFIHSVVWKSLFGKQVDYLEKTRN
jgi:hypothetical protein